VRVFSSVFFLANAVDPVQTLFSTVDRFAVARENKVKIVSPLWRPPMEDRLTTSTVKFLAVCADKSYEWF
jgi:hypothetical protein